MTEPGTDIEVAPRYHLSHVAVENVKGIRGCQVTITDDALVIVSGGNGDGKSSFIDAIWYTLVGKKAMAEGKNPLTMGADKGFAEVIITADNGAKLKVTRRFTAGKPSSIEVLNLVTGKEERKRPAETIESMCGPMALSPLAFMEKSPAKQIELLSVALNLPIDLVALDAEKTDVFGKRTAVGRDVDRLRKSIDLMPEPPAGLPSEPLSMDELVAESEAAQAAQQHRADLARAHDDASRRSRNANDRVTTLRAQLEEAENELRAARRDETVARDAENANLAEELPDQEAIRERMRSLAETNSQIDQAKARAARIAELALVQSEYDGYTARLDAIQAEKRDALAAVKMPYEGLAIAEDGDGLTLYEVPLKDCSAAEQRLVACSLAMDPTALIRMVRIEDGSLLDEDFLRKLEAMAAERDYQVIIEIVDSTGAAGGIVFSDGEIVTAPDA